MRLRVFNTASVITASVIFAFSIALSASLETSVAHAQSYPMQTPFPRSTDVPTLHAQAVRREIHERFRLGLDAEAQGDWAAAAGEFERAVALNPAEPQGSTARYNLAIAYANLGRNDDAAVQLQSAIDLDPGFLAAMANLVAIELRRGDLHAARTAADRFVAAAPDSARALYSRGLVALQSGDAQSAVTDFGRLLSHDPEYAVAHYDLGVAEVRLGHNDDAEREFAAALVLSPTYARARLSLGTVLLQRGDRIGAREAFERAARDAESDPALENLAVAMRDAVSTTR